MWHCFGSGKQQFPWIHIHDVARFINLIVQDSSLNGSFNIASPENITHYDFIKKMKKIKYPNSMLIHVPKKIIEILMPQKHALIFNDISLDIEKMKKSNFTWDYPNIEKLIKHGLS